MRLVLLVVVLALVPSIVRSEGARADSSCPRFCPTCPAVGPKYVLDDRAPAARSHAKWFAIAGGALWIASGVYAYRVQQDYNTASPETFRVGDRALAESRMATGGAVFAGGTLLLLTSGYLYFVLGKKQPAVAPVVGQDRVGVALAKRF